MFISTFMISLFYNCYVIPTLELHSKAAPSVDAHQHVNSPNTGRNSGGRWIIKKTMLLKTFTVVYNFFLKKPVQQWRTSVTHVLLFQTAYKMTSCRCIVAGQVSEKTRLYTTFTYLIFLSVIIDVQSMFFIGFGFLMTFMKRFGYTAVTLTLLVTLLYMQRFRQGIGQTNGILW